MTKKANKSINTPESDFHKLLMKAYQRAQTSRNIANILGVARNTVKNWLSKYNCNPNNIEEHTKKLTEFIEQPFVSKANPSKRQRLWQTMRCIGVFKTSEIAAIAETTENHARQYISGLFKAGYLRLAGKKSYSHIWQLIRNTGPKAPEVSRMKNYVYDPNLEEEVWRKEVAA